MPLSSCEFCVSRCKGVNEIIRILYISAPFPVFFNADAVHKHSLTKSFMQIGAVTVPIFLGTPLHFGP